MTGMSTLLAALAVIAASLLGGCSNSVINAGGSAARTPAPAAAVDPAPPRQAAASPTAPQTPAPPAAEISAPAASQMPTPAVGQVSAPAVAQMPAPVTPAVSGAAAPTATAALGEQLASAALDDDRLSNIRGGFDAGSGVTLNFAFQQATFVNHNLVETVVTPTLTISPGQLSPAAGGAQAMAGGVRPSVGTGSLGAFGVNSTPATSGVGGINSAVVVANGGVQTQVSVSTPVLQALVNSGMASVVGNGGVTSNNGISTTITNAANNQLIQQMTTVDIGVSGLSKLMQQTVPTTVLNRLSGPNGFR